jgi:HKD family nuclease
MQIINNIGSSNHLTTINELISKYDNILLCSGWMKFEGAKLISDNLKRALKRGANILIATNEKHTGKRSINLLKKLGIKHALIKKANDVKYFHTKFYYFEGNGEYVYIIGSANITEGALLDSDELSVCISGSISDQNHQQIQPYIEHIMNSYFTGETLRRTTTLSSVDSS